MSFVSQSEFEESASGRRVRQVLSKRKTLPVHILRQVRDAVLDVIPHLTPGHRYTTEDLCGPELWASWAPGERISAGVCLSYLVSNRKVPLMLHTTPSGTGTKRYFLP